MVLYEILFIIHYRIAETKAFNLTLTRYIYDVMSIKTSQTLYKTNDRNSFICHFLLQ